MTLSPRPAEQLLLSLGVHTPSEIDLDAIAYDQGCVVRYELLDGCEAQLLGNGARGIITISTRATPRRRRFSLAHELGHWHHHRGRAFVCRASDIGERKPLPSSLMNPERVADSYAADLVLPRFLFEPAAQAMRHPGMDEIEALAESFDVSITATALRLLRANRFPMLLVCYDSHRRRWNQRSLSAPDWWLRQELDPRSNALEVLHRGQRRSRLRSVPASAWFEGRTAEQQYVHEQTIRVADDEVLTVLFFGARTTFV